MQCLVYYMIRFKRNCVKSSPVRKLMFFALIIMECVIDSFKLLIMSIPSLFDKVFAKVVNYK